MSGIVGDNTARASGVVASAGGGAILQVKSVQLSNAISVGSAATPAAITAFDIAFTPTAANSKWCLHVSLQAGSNSGTAGYFYDSTGAAKIMPYGADAGSRQRLSWFGVAETYSTANCAFTAWFTPGDTTTRTIQVWGAASASSTLYINRCDSTGDYDSINYSRSASTFTITEYDGSLVTVA